MSADANRVTILGLSRFGLGARPGELQNFSSDIRGALLNDVSLEAVAVPAGENVLPSAEAFHRFRVERDEIKAARQAEAEKKPAPSTDMAAAANPEEKAAPAVALDAGQKPNPQPDPAKLPKRQVPRELFQAETTARMEAALKAKTGFAERLVLFWSNHFCVSARKSGVLRVLAGPFEREAIRPHIFGRFADMLLAVEKHPAMLAYLDNEQSIGPNSQGGQRAKKGLNENLAREIMELHTLGVGGGYSQEDVTALARILTGWRFARKDNALSDEGRFLFNVNLHEPGEHKLLGRTYDDNGLAQGEAALLTLAYHSATAHHIATKLAVHFVSDAPDPALVAKLEKTFHETGGDLAAVSRALIEAPEAWREEQTKLRTPYEFLAAALRATGVALKPPQINGSLASMGQPLWSPPGPNGFPDLASAWISPEGMKARLDVASQIGSLVTGDAKPADVLLGVLGTSVSEETKTAVARAESGAQGFALLLMSPEFQRR